MKLEGIRVLDLSLFLPGPLLTQMMADHGAEVIKLEPINGGEPNREIGTRRADGVTVYFQNTHRGKKSVQLNLKTEAGREALLKLAETADVMIEGSDVTLIAWGSQMQIMRAAVSDGRLPANCHPPTPATGRDGQGAARRVVRGD